ncbi:MAG: hypothetical protein M1832_003927 [Thelocarpon impressellum]|nr:MAG: hypothetical protein M1832_003927 [Thelocarpon impressellum]
MAALRRLGPDGQAEFAAVEDVCQPSPWIPGSPQRSFTSSPRPEADTLRAPTGRHSMEGPIAAPPRPSTAPLDQKVPASFSPSLKAMSLPFRQHTMSPFSRSHLRSRSSAGSLTPPAMTRAHSMPVVDDAGRVIMSTTAARPSSPLGSSTRHRMPSRRFTDEAMLTVAGHQAWGVAETVPEDAELDSTPRASETRYTPSSPLIPLHPGHTFPRRRRPSSPLRPPIPTPASGPTASTPASASSSPLFPPTRFNEAYPGSSTYQISFSSNSSLPSTPTSARSRSPSISSLETIPDSPDAEEAALEAERIAQLKAAADAADGADGAGQGSGSGQRRKSGLDPGSGGRGGSPGPYGARDKKQRWSVCGAERRGDLDLETIWED